MSESSATPIINDGQPLLQKQRDVRKKVPPPCGSYFITFIVILLLLLAWILSFVIQVILALFTCPMCCCSNGRLCFHKMQSYVWRNINAMFMIVLNPAWSATVFEIGNDIGLPDRGPDDPGCIIFCNHRSNSDPFFTAWLGMKYCFEAKYVYKSMLKMLPFAGCAQILTGDLPVHRGERDWLLQKSREVLEAGGNIVVFPEGIRSPSGILQDFKPAYFQLCCEVGCPALPVCLLGTEKAWPTGGWRLGCASVTIAIGGATIPCKGTSAEDLSSSVRNAIRGLAKEVEDDADAELDPILTGIPYPWFKMPKALEGKPFEEQITLLRQGKAHERNKGLA